MQEKHVKIDIKTEQLVTLSDATKLLPPRRNSARPCLSTLSRWAQDGYRGIRLETLCVGGTRCTSVEAIQRFCDAITDASEPAPDLPSPRLSASRRRQIETAERRLAKAGI